MERKDQRPSEGEEEEGLIHVEGKVVPPSPCSPVEKPSVPLNSLKMMFETGEGAKRRVRLIDSHTHTFYSKTFSFRQTHTVGMYPSTKVVPKLWGVSPGVGG